MTSTSPGVAKIMRLELGHLVGVGPGAVERVGALQDVAHGERRPDDRGAGRVGRSTEAPMTPGGTPSSSMASDTTPLGSPSAMKRSTTPCGGRGTVIMRCESGRDAAGELLVDGVHQMPPVRID